MTLFEANLVNNQRIKDEIEDWLYDDLDSRYNDQIKNWFLTQFYKWYISSQDDHLKSISKRDPQPNDPQWAKGKELYQFNGFTPEEMTYLIHIADYFRSLNENEIQKIYKQSYPVIQQKVREWDQKLASKTNNRAKFTEEGKDFETVYTFPDGYKFVKLSSKGCFDDEGNLMGHCVGGYHGTFTWNIYSLRDKNNNPHATLKTDLGTLHVGRRWTGVHEIKGKQNLAPIQKYWSYIKEFIKKMGWYVKADGKNIGFVRYENHWYDPDSKEWDDLYNTEIKRIQDSKLHNIKSRIDWENKEYRGNIDLSNIFLRELPEFLKDITVTEGFYCGYNILTSLKNAPQIVHGDFICSTNQLTTLEEAPKEVGGVFRCDDNPLTSLKGAPEEVTAFICSKTSLITLEGSPRIIWDYFTAVNIPTLESLIGGPEQVGKDYVVGLNPKLKSLIGAPVSVGRHFSCSGSSLVSLEGLSPSIGPNLHGDIDKNVFIFSNPVKFTQEDIDKAQEESRARRRQVEESYTEMYLEYFNLQDFLGL